MVTVTVPQWLTDPIPFAHRGLHSEKLPENSLGAFRAAMAAGLPVELDLQMTADNRLVVFHDRNLERLAGVRMSVTNNKLDRLRTVPLFHTQEQMPTLEDLLSTVDGAVPLLIEIKPAKIRTAERAAAVAQLMSQYSGPFALQSFDPRIVKWLKRHTDHCTGLIVGRYRDPSTPVSLRRRLELFWLAEAKESLKKDPDFIAHDLKLLSPGIADHYRLERKVPVLTWTVKEPRQVAQANALADNYIFEGFTPSL